MGAQCNILYFVLGAVVSLAILQRQRLWSTVIKYERWCEVHKRERKREGKKKGNHRQMCL